MTNDETVSNDDARTLRHRLAQVVRIAQVRLRFVLVIVAIAVVAGSWDTLADFSDRAIARLMGRGPGDAAVSPDTEHFCPMCPGVISNWPEKCPVCNMPLVRRRKGEAVLLPEGVTARMQLSPYRVQLAGIRTSPVAYLPLDYEFQTAGFVQVDPEQTTDRTRLVVDVAVPLRDLASVRLGQPAEVAAPMFLPNTTWNATVAEIQSAVDPRTSQTLVRLTVENSDQRLLPGIFVNVTWRTPAADVEPFRSQPRDPPAQETGEPGAASVGLTHPPGHVLAVPQTAVVDTGRERLVYVETGPGMFDGVVVELGPRAGDHYPVVKGLAANQRVVTVGAFLLDAETRLNPSLAAAYFGAGSAPQTSSATGSSANPATDVRSLLAKFDMTPADRAAAEAQRVCPVTKLPLGSMGAPVRVTVRGKSVFLCCEGCNEAFEK